MKNFNHIKEPSIEEFYERCKNIEEEKKQRSIEKETKFLVEKLGRNPTTEELCDHIRNISKKIFNEIQSKINKK